MADNILQKIILEVDPEIAEMIYKNADKLQELVFRRADKKFQQFVKAKIVDSNPPEEAAKQIMQAAVKVQDSFKKNKAAIHKVVNKINLAAKKLDLMDMNLDKISVNLDSIMNSMGDLENLAFVQIALSVINIAVDVAGFIIIAQKMNGLSNQLDQIAAALGDLKDISVENMRSDCEKLSLDYNSFVDKIQNKDAIKLDELEEYLKRSKPFISKLVRLLEKKAVDTEVLLNMIFTLLPAYTSILSIFLKAYYTEKHSTPSNYENFLDVYQDINSPEFRNSVQDYYLLEKGFNYSAVIDILNVQLYTVFSERLELEDELTLLEIFGDKEYAAFEKGLDKAVLKEITEKAEEISENCGEYADECRRILKLEI